MGQTKTDLAAILASAIGFLIAVYGVISEPLTVDSARPTQTKAPSETGKNAVADARLWDDPFLVFRDSSDYEYRPAPVKDGAKVLVLVVPTSTRLYQEDRENRLRLRFAIQRALLDQGYAPTQGSLLFALKLPRLNQEEGSPKENAISSVASEQEKPKAHDNDSAPVQMLLLSKRPSNGLSPQSSPAPQSCSYNAPVQFFDLQKLAQTPFQERGDDQYTLVTVVWLPDEVVWDHTPKQNQNIITLINHDLDGALKQRYISATARPQYAVLGPWDSDELAYLESIAMPSTGELPWIVSYRATVAEPILQDLPDATNIADLSGHVVSNGGGENHSLDGNKTCQIPVFRLPNRADVLCQALLNEILTRGTLPLHGRNLNVWVFSEWDTLYGRSLAETFRALAGSSEDITSVTGRAYRRLREALIKANPRLQDGLPASNKKPSISITVVPYLRGLDGASTPYADRYVRSEAKGEDTQASKQADREIESAEGATQFDYIRRLTSTLLTEQVPFLPHLKQPDAIVIFGSDVYDKLVLLKFLKQVLKNCTYLTTDLDALYWHPHYLQFTRDLVVASAFPLTMKPSLCGPGVINDLSSDTPVQFRDSYQSAVYLSVTRLLRSFNIHPNDDFFASVRRPIIYRIGNTKPLPLDGSDPLSTGQDKSDASGIVESNLAALASRSISLIDTGMLIISQFVDELLSFERVKRRLRRTRRISSSCEEMCIYAFLRMSSARESQSRFSRLSKIVVSYTCYCRYAPSRFGGALIGFAY
jgi:hypothetical protein